MLTLIHFPRQTMYCSSVANATVYIFIFICHCQHGMPLGLSKNLATSYNAQLNWSMCPFAWKDSVLLHEVHTSEEKNNREATQRFSNWSTCRSLPCRHVYPSTSTLLRAYSKHRQWHVFPRNR